MEQSIPSFLKGIRYMGLVDNAKEAMFLSITATIFCASVITGYNVFDNTAKMNKVAYSMNNELDKNMHSTLIIEDNDTYTGAEVRQSIFQINEGQIDIVVDGTTFSKNLDPMAIDVSGISLTKKYTPTYVRDASGKLTLLKFS
ncbi:hypothetical protein [Paenibacillus sp. CFBP13512]|uniref:hypothetical protein n=1 Tax=Paenibacillus sp. CFBP13512 TaxID=2184007 RepID=UPI0010C04FC5|nr:hypothetical protein [Paenibacillus sp. CFBP13512]